MKAPRSGSCLPLLMAIFLLGCGDSKGNPEESTDSGAGLEAEQSAKQDESQPRDCPGPTEKRESIILSDLGCLRAGHVEKDARSAEPRASTEEQVLRFLGSYGNGVKCAGRWHSTEGGVSQMACEAGGVEFDGFSAYVTLNFLRFDPVGDPPRGSGEGRLHYISLRSLESGPGETKMVRAFEATAEKLFGEAAESVVEGMGVKAWHLEDGHLFLFEQKAAGRRFVRKRKYDVVFLGPEREALPMYYRSRISAEVGEVPCPVCARTENAERLTTEDQIEDLAKSCRDNNLSDCFAAGRAMVCAPGDLRQSTDSYDRWRMARLRVERACEGEVPGACYMLGCMRLLGEGPHLDFNERDIADLQRQDPGLQFPCGEESLAECGVIGFYWKANRNEPRNDESALPLFEKACSAGGMDACERAGDVRMRGADEDVDEKIAREHFEKACNLGSNSGCAQLGATLVFGHGGPPDTKRGVQLMEEACEKGSGRGCFDLAELFAGETRPGRGKMGVDLSRAREHYALACDAYHSDACYRVGKMCWFGKGGDVDRAGATRYYKRALRTGEYSRSAIRLPRDYMKYEDADRRAQFEVIKKGAIWKKAYGHYLKRKARADHLVARDEKKCVAGDAKACVRIAESCKATKQSVSISICEKENLGRACKAGDSEACCRHEMLQRYTYQRVSEKLCRTMCVAGDARVCKRLGDKKWATDLSQQQCQAGEAGSCILRADLIEEVDSADLDTFLGRACDLGSADGCQRFTNYLSDPRRTQTQQDQATRVGARARKLFLSRCKRSDPESCHQLGIMIEYGHGGPPDSQVANKYYLTYCGLMGLADNCGYMPKIVQWGLPD